MAASSSSSFRYSVLGFILVAMIVGVVLAVQGGTGAEGSHAPVHTPVRTSAAMPTAAPSSLVSPTHSLAQFPANGQFDYQLGGAYTPGASVSILDRDRTANPVAGKYNICYVNAYQTQPDDPHTWSGVNADLILHNKAGAKVGDPEWDEYLLDTSTQAKRDRIASIMGAWIDSCAAKGYQAVEPDNLDSWTRSQGLLTRADNVALAQSLAMRAHQAGLAIAQKNTPQLGASEQRAIGFDFAIAEECQQYTECNQYTKAYGKNVLEIEYTDNPRSAFTQACALRGAQIAIILRDRDVVPHGNPAYHYESC